MLLTIVYKICCHHDVRKVVILVELGKILGYCFRVHETERCVCIRYLYLEVALQEEAYDLLDESSGLAVASYCSVTEDALVAVAHLPESIEFLRQCLSVRVSLENEISALLDSIIVKSDYLGAVLLASV